MAKNSKYTAVGGKYFLKLNSATPKIYYSQKNLIRETIWVETHTKYKKKCVFLPFFKN